MSDLLYYLEEASLVHESLLHPAVKVSIFDGAALVNMLQPGTAKTFKDYAINVFITYITTPKSSQIRYYLGCAHA